jgi:hypothetical protein
MNTSPYKKGLPCAGVSGTLYPIDGPTIVKGLYNKTRAKDLIAKLNDAFNAGLTVIEAPAPPTDNLEQQAMEFIIEYVKADYAANFPEYPDDYVAREGARQAKSSTKLLAAFGNFLSQQAVPNREAIREKIARIERWFDEFPETGKTWNDGTPMSYGAAYGSNGERDYMRAIAREALSLLDKSDQAGDGGVRELQEAGDAMAHRLVYTERDDPHEDHIDILLEEKWQAARAKAKPIDSIKVGEGAPTVPSTLTNEQVEKVIHDGWDYLQHKPGCRSTRFANSMMSHAPISQRTCTCGLDKYRADLRTRLTNLR